MKSHAASGKLDRLLEYERLAREQSQDATPPYEKDRIAAEMRVIEQLVLGSKWEIIGAAEKMSELLKLEREKEAAKIQPTVIA